MAISSRCDHFSTWTKPLATDFLRETLWHTNQHSCPTLSPALWLIKVHCRNWMPSCSPLRTWWYTTITGSEQGCPKIFSWIRRLFTVGGTRIYTTRRRNLRPWLNANRQVPMSSSIRASSADLSTTVIMSLPIEWSVNEATGHEGNLDSSCRTVTKDTVRARDMEYPVCETQPIYIMLSH